MRPSEEPKRPSAGDLGVSVLGLVLGVMGIVLVVFFFLKEDGDSWGEYLIPGILLALAAYQGVMTVLGIRRRREARRRAEEPGPPPGA
ncbi:hypothetical protein AB0L05_35275 [Nonomuraea pusilla]|uniref:hypothetical protein n=1 Tax=Nonomuraea pusilla TaxID=46177 RepID=UPI003322B9A4